MPSFMTPSSTEVRQLDRDLSRLAEKVNGWRELGEEMERIALFMSEEQRADLLPDWFLPRLKEMLADGR